MVESRSDRYIAELQKFEPKLKIAYKDESLFMKFLAAILFFNKDFATQYVTTIGKTIYYPSRTDFESYSSADIIHVVGHEYTHMRDNSRNPLFPVLYLFPQLLAPFFLIVGIWSWWVAIPLFLAFLAPLPAYVRMKAELKGYTMTYFIINEIFKERGMPIEERKAHLLSNIPYTNKLFTSFSYYVMWPFGVEKQLTQATNKIITEEISREDPIFSEITQAMTNSKV